MLAFFYWFEISRRHSRSESKQSRQCFGLLVQLGCVVNSWAVNFFSAFPFPVAILTAADAEMFNVLYLFYSVDNSNVLLSILTH